MVAVLYTEGCIISSFTAGPLSVSHSNGKNANIILVYKQKGDRTECGYSRGISLLSVTGKVLAVIMLTHLLEHVVDLVLPESQCLIINTMKTEMLSASSPDVPTFSISGISLKTLKILLIWAQISHFLVTSQMRS